MARIKLAPSLVLTSLLWSNESVRWSDLKTEEGELTLYKSAITALYEKVRLEFLAMWISSVFGG